MARLGATPWSIVSSAARGEPEDREALARLYEPAVRAYLQARWHGSLWAQDVDDAVQEVFLACFREGGVLERVRAGRPGGFRAYLYGVIRNKALDHERKLARRRDSPRAEPLETDRQTAGQDSLGALFDKAWARSVLREAVVRQQELAAELDEGARSRVELLRLRFNDGMPIREIAKAWNVDAARLHHEYARARREFREALLDVEAYLHPDASPGELERECRRLAEPFLE